MPTPQPDLSFRIMAEVGCHACLLGLDPISTYIPAGL